MLSRSAIEAIERKLREMEDTGNGEVDTSNQLHPLLEQARIKREQEEARKRRQHPYKRPRNKRRWVLFRAQKVLFMVLNILSSLYIVGVVSDQRHFRVPSQFYSNSVLMLNDSAVFGEEYNALKRRVLIFEGNVFVFDSTSRSTCTRMFLLASREDLRLLSSNYFG